MTHTQFTEEYDFDFLEYLEAYADILGEANTNANKLAAEELDCE
jgi:hypothetical protein